MSAFIKQHNNDVIHFSVARCLRGAVCGSAFEPLDGYVTDEYILKRYTVWKIYYVTECFSLVFFF